MEVIDVNVLGQRIAAARRAIGAREQGEFVLLLKEKWNYDLGLRRLRDLETGKATPRFDEMLVIVAALRSVGGLAFLRPAIRDDVAEGAGVDWPFD